jgi:hypothetical protein
LCEARKPLAHARDCTHTGEPPREVVGSIRPVVPNCLGPDGCCTELCDLADASGGSQCSGEPLGQQCLAYFEADGPPEYSDVGVCAIP